MLFQGASKDPLVKLGAFRTRRASFLWWKIDDISLDIRWYTIHSGYNSSLAFWPGDWAFACASKNVWVASDPILER